MATLAARSQKKPAVGVKDENTQAAELTPQMLAFLHVFALGCGKIGYKQSDAALDKIAATHRPGARFEMPEISDELVDILVEEFRRFAHGLAGQKFRLVDEWRGKRKVSGGMSVRRNSLEQITEPRRIHAVAKP